MDCEKTCHLNKKCLEKFTITEIIQERYKYWGKRQERAPSRLERANQNDLLLGRFFDETSPNKFKFHISGKELCESMYLRIMGIFFLYFC